MSVDLYSATSDVLLSVKKAAGSFEQIDAIKHVQSMPPVFVRTRYVLCCRTFCRYSDCGSQLPGGEA